MTNENWEMFREYLDAAFEQYGKPPLTDRGARLMFENLRDLELKAVIDGLNLHIRMNRYVPPSAAAVRELVAEDVVGGAYEKALNARKVANSQESVRFDDPIIHAAIQECGGWREFFFMTKAESSEKFIPAYTVAFRKRMGWDDVPDHLAGAREFDNSFLDPWTPDQIVEIESHRNKAVIPAERQIGK